MSRRSYFTTPLFVIITLMGLGVFIYAHDTNAIQDNISNQMYHDNLGYYADLIPRMEQLRNKQKAGHIATPDSIRAIYISSWVAGTPSLRNKLINFIETSNINAVVIDIKD